MSLLVIVFISACACHGISGEQIQCGYAKCDSFYEWCDALQWGCSHCDQLCSCVPDVCLEHISLEKKNVRAKPFSAAELCEIRCPEYYRSIISKTETVTRSGSSTQMPHTTEQVFDYVKAIIEQVFDYVIALINCLLSIFIFIFYVFFHLFISFWIFLIYRWYRRSRIAARKSRIAVPNSYTAWPFSLFDDESYYFDEDTDDTEENIEEDTYTEPISTVTYESLPASIPATFFDIDSDTRDDMSHTDQEIEDRNQEETPLKHLHGSESQDRNQTLDEETPVKQLKSAQVGDQMLESTNTSVKPPYTPATNSRETQDGSVACDCGSHMAGDTEGESSHESTSASTALVNITEELSATDGIDITEEFEYELSLHEDLPGVGDIGNLRIRNSGNAAPLNQYESESLSLHISSSSGSHFSVPNLAGHTFSATNPFGHSTSVPSSAGVRLSMEGGEESLPAEQPGMEVQPLDLPDDTECRLVHRREYT